MPDISKIRHTIKSKTTSLKEAAEFMHKCPDEKIRARIALMRETAQDIVRLLIELEAELQKPV
jgi:hypothetical protein